MASASASVSASASASAITSAKNGNGKREFTELEQNLFESILIEGIHPKKAMEIVENVSKNMKTDKKEDTKPKTHTFYVIDRSGSMQSYGSDSYGSIQSSIDNLQKDRNDPNGHISVLTFDDQIEWVHKNICAKGYKLPEDAMRPRNTTALRDAILTVIDYAETLTDETKKYIIIFTDGEDNDSKTSIKTMKKRLILAKEKGIDFTFLSAGESKISDATDMGIDACDTLSVGKKGSHMRSAMRSAVGKQHSGFTQEQREDADSDSD